MFAVTMTLVIINVFSRYFFNHPIAWCDEVATSCFVYTVFVGSAWCLRTRQHVGVDLLIDRFGISSHQISRIFRQKTGYGFREYLISLRMQRAKELVVSSDQSIADIATNLGYGNATYYIKTFKLYYGITPMQLKKQSDSISQF